MTSEMNNAATTLADLDTRIGLFPDAMPPAGASSARKALWRVAAAANATTSSVPVDEALPRYEALQETMAKSSFYDERAYLRKALTLPDLPTEIALRVRAGEATFADAAVIVRLQPWGKECGRVVGALKRLAKKIGIPMDRLPASLASVEQALAKLTHADFAVARSSYAEFRRRIRRAVRLVDINARRRLSRSLLTGPWRALVDKITDHEPSRGGDLAMLWPLLEHCYHHDLGLDQVTDQTIASMQVDLERRGRKDPFTIARDAVYAWERLQRHVEGFPKQRLSRLYRTGHDSPFAVPFKDLPEAFRQDWQAYVDRFFEDRRSEPASLAELVTDATDPAAGFRAALDRRLNGSPDKRSARAVPNLRTTITYAANVALARGLRVETVKGLLNADILTGVIEAMIDRRSHRLPDLKGDDLHKCNTHRTTVGNYISMARDLGVEAPEIARMSAILDTVDPHLIKAVRNADDTFSRQWRKDRMGPRHAERLRQFNNEVKLLAWFDIRISLLKRAKELVKRRRKPTLKQVNDMTVCVLHHITRTCPARRENLAELKTYGQNRNLLMPSRAKAKGHIHIDWFKTKNKEPQNAELTEEAVEVIALYLDHFRPVLAKAVGADPGNPYLFPAYGMNHRDAGLLNKAFVDRNWTIGGIRLNLHCQRHLCAKLVLDADPGQMPLVQTILAHRSIKTTESYYGEINQIIAQRRFHQLLEQRERELRAAGKPKPRG